MPDITQLETFVLTRELGSLAAVGRYLGISSAAVSKQLTKLEEQLNTQLLIRTTRQITLTEIGESYYEQCKRIMSEMSAANDLISNVKSTPHGNLKVTSGRYFAQQYIVPHLAEFLGNYPEINLDLELAERIPDVVREEIDVVIGMSVPMTGDVIQKRILTTRYCLCASHKYLKQWGTPKKISELKRHHYITHSMRQPDDEVVFRNREIGKMVPYIRVNDVDAMIQLALEGTGIVYLHEYAVREYIKKGSLVELLENETLRDVPIFVAYPQMKFVPSKIRAFIDFVVGKL